MRNRAGVTLSSRVRCPGRSRRGQWSSRLLRAPVPRRPRIAQFPLLLQRFDPFAGNVVGYVVVSGHLGDAAESPVVHGEICRCAGPLRPKSRSPNALVVNRCSGSRCRPVDRWCCLYRFCFGTTCRRRWCCPGAARRTGEHTGDVNQKRKIKIGHRFGDAFVAGRLGPNRGQARARGIEFHRCGGKGNSCPVIGDRDRIDFRHPCAAVGLRAVRGALVGGVVEFAEPTDPSLCCVSRHAVMFGYSCNRAEPLVTGP